MYSSSIKKSRSYYQSNTINNDNKTINKLYERLENNESVHKLLSSVNNIITKSKSDNIISPNTIYSDLQIFKNIVKIHEAFENFTLFGVFKKNQYNSGIKPIKVKQSVKIKKNIFLYVKKYGHPKNGIFDPEKLREFN